MQRHLKRLGLALAASVAGLVLTLGWYYAGQPKRRVGAGQGSVARLTESTDEVQRRETTRVIWETIALNDDLFAGEAVRTSARASAKLQLKSGAVIHLDPDSLVVLEQNATGISLDFLEGNLFVDGARAGGDAGVTLKTARGEIAVNGASLSLSKTSRGEVDLEVYRGQAQLSQGDRKTAVGQDRAATLSAEGVRERGDLLKLTSPKAGESVLLNLAGGEKLDVTWTPLSPGSAVTIEYGSSRARLSASDRPVAGDLGRARLSLKPGKWFVRLTARTAEGVEMASLVTPFELGSRAAPALIEPANDAEVVKTASTDSTHFRWVDRNPFVGQIFEIATDPRFKTVVHSANLGPAADELDHALPLGTYYWRVTGFTKSGGAGLTSAVARLRLVKTIDERATLNQPADGARLSAVVAAAGVTFDWRAPVDQNYNLSVTNDEGSEVFAATSRAGTARAPTLKPGGYAWTVRTAAGASAPHQFTVVEPPRLAWTDQRDTFTYGGDRATFGTTWTPVAGAAGYRYRLVGQGESAADVPWISAPQASATATASRDGAYQVSLQALDARGEVLAEAPPRAISIARRALLPAPAWPVDVTTFTADPRGGVTFSWNAVEGARTYVLSVRDANGRVTERTVPRGPASLSKLKPGAYRVRVRAVDEFSRPGVVSDERPLEVPNASDIRAPRLRAVKVR